MNFMTTGFVLFSFGVFMTHPIQATGSEESSDDHTIMEDRGRIRRFFSESFEPSHLDSDYYLEKKSMDKPIEDPVEILRLFFRSVFQPFDPKQTGNKPVMLDIDLKEEHSREEDIWMARLISQNIRHSKDIFLNGSVQYRESYRAESFYLKKKDTGGEMVHHAYRLFDAEREESRGFDICLIIKKGEAPLPKESRKKWERHKDRPDSTQEIEFEAYQKKIRPKNKGKGLFKKQKKPAGVHNGDLSQVHGKDLSPDVTVREGSEVQNVMKKSGKMARNAPTVYKKRSNKARARTSLRGESDFGNSVPITREKGSDTAVILESDSDSGGLFRENVTAQRNGKTDVLGGHSRQRTKPLKKAKSQMAIANHSLENQKLIDELRSTKRFLEKDSKTHFALKRESLVRRNGDRNLQFPSVADINNT